MAKDRLPEEFRDLERFGAWMLETETERNLRRLESDIAEIRAFHDAMVNRAEAAIAYLEGIGLERIEERQDRNLLNLLLSLAEVTPAVEYYGAPGVRGGFDSRRMIPFDV